jgi:2'-5' RNA ligase
LREFLAIALPQAATEALEALQRILRPACPGWRWVRPGNLHLTLRFLGEVDGETDRAARVRWREASARVGPFRLEFDAVGSFPDRGRPRVLWIGLRESPPSGRLPRLADGIETAARVSGFDPSRRPFRPHLTLARAARGERATLPAEPSGGTVPPPVDVTELVLFASELNPEGARYTALERFPLVGTEDGSRE